MSLKNNLIWEIIYISEYNENKLKIFDKLFVDNNKDKCKIIYNHKEYELKEYFEEIDNRHNNQEIKIKIKDINNIYDMSYMFNNCKNLFKIFDKSKENDLQDSFESKNNSSEYNIEISLLDTTKNNSSDKNDIIYEGCETNLSSMSSITMRNITDYISISNNIYSINSILNPFYIINVMNLKNMFNNCSSLISLPDLSKWKTSNVTDMSNMFRECHSLTSLPGISK